MVCGRGQAKNQMCRPIEKNLLDLLTSGFPLAGFLLHSTAIPCWGSLRKSAVIVNNQAGARSGLMQRDNGRQSRPPRQYILNDGGRFDLLFASSMAALILWDFPPSLKAESRHTFAFILSLQDYFHRFLITLAWADSDHIHRPMWSLTASLVVTTASWQQGLVQVHHKWAEGITLRWVNTFQSTRSTSDLRYNLYHESEIPRNRALFLPKLIPFVCVSCIRYTIYRLSRGVLASLQRQVFLWPLFLLKF